MARLSGAPNCQRSKPLVQSSSRFLIEKRRGGLGTPDLVGAENSRMESTGIVQTPTTPVKTPYRHKEDGTSLGVLYTPSREARRVAAEIPANDANIGRCRVDHRSMLSHSPARPGYSSRMKQIFEDIGNSTITSSNHERVQYPQLPHVSDPMSPGASKQKHAFVPSAVNSTQRLGMLSSKALSPLSVVKPNSTTSTTLYDNSSGSWSDDSGYINADRSLTQKVVATPQTRVHDWLSTVAETSHDTENKSRISSQSPFADSNDLGRDLYYNEMPDITHNMSFPFRNREDGLADPFVSRITSNNAILSENTGSKLKPSYRLPLVIGNGRHVSDTCKKLNLSDAMPPSSDGENASATLRYSKATSFPTAHSAQRSETELTTLSPNVCIERGTAQQRLSRTGSSHKASTTAAYKVAEDGLKENLAAEAETLYSNRMWQDISPTMFGRSRFAMPLQQKDVETNELNLASTRLRELHGSGTSSI